MAGRLPCIFRPSIAKRPLSVGPHRVRGRALRASLEPPPGEHRDPHESESGHRGAPSAGSHCWALLRDKAPSFGGVVNLHESTGDAPFVGHRSEPILVERGGRRGLGTAGVMVERRVVRVGHEPESSNPYASHACAFLALHANLRPMSGLLRSLVGSALLICLTGCPEKKPEGSGAAAPPSSSATPAKGAPAPGSGGW